MKTETIVCCVVALILGMLIANMLKSVCGCKSVVEGQTIQELVDGGMSKENAQRFFAAEGVRTYPCNGVEYVSRYDDEECKTCMATKDGISGFTSPTSKYAACGGTSY